MSSYARASHTRINVAEIVKPPNREPLSQSARRLLYVELGNSMVPWDGDLTPYMAEPMDTLKSRRYTSTIFVGPARTAKSVSLVDAWAMDTIVNDPADFLLVQISQEKAAEHSQKRLDRGFNACPEVRAALSPRAHDNNIHSKFFKAGNFLKIGWPSKNIFASSTYKRVAITDYDRIPLNVGGDGSTYFQASKRTQSFMSSGMTMAESSPGFYVTDSTYRVSSPHEAPPTPGILSLYNLGDRRLFFWQCPECGEHFEPEFKLLVWDKEIDDPGKASKEVFLACPHCGAMHQEKKPLERGKSLKWCLNKRGVWVPEGCTVDQNRQLHGERKDTHIASFWQKGPTAAFQTWNELVYKYLAAMQVYESTGEMHDLQTTVNTDQGLPFIPPKDQDRSANELMDRRDDYGCKEVPENVRFLTAAIDVQGGKKSRFEVMVLGWGEDLQSTVIDRFNIEKSKRQDPENPDKFVRVKPSAYLEDWDLITEKVINKTYPLTDGTGRFMPVLLTACDSGGEAGVTDMAYQFYRRIKKLGLSRKIMLIKGRDGKGGKDTSVIEKSYPDNTKREDRKAKAKGDVPVFLLLTDKIKDTVQNSLSRDKVGPRYVHFPKWLPESFFDELTVEERGPDGKWRKPNSQARNEAFDLFVYNWAAIYERKADRIRDWENPPLWALPQDSNPELISTDKQQAVPTRRRRRR
ncbi:phage terminase large subunit family protein [Pseudoalteromonas umbrosa]|uniref:phage terminase large subunit family protein n=1 Tax=Pseudoalteromonas umbrosa TaxID=3048489 RepID=UPI0024C308FF|nr:terminase gpA endonuclease subunit [Pseudoalteromonas sp. B95]